MMSVLVQTHSRVSGLGKADDKITSSNFVLERFGMANANVAANTFVHDALEQRPVRSRWPGPRNIQHLLDVNHCSVISALFLNRK